MMKFRVIGWMETKSKNPRLQRIKIDATIMEPTVKAAVKFGRKVLKGYLKTYKKISPRIVYAELQKVIPVQKIRFSDLKS